MSAKDDLFMLRNHRVALVVAPSDKPILRDHSIGLSFYEPMLLFVYAVCKDSTGVTVLLLEVLF